MSSFKQSLTDFLSLRTQSESSIHCSSESAASEHFLGFDGEMMIRRVIPMSEDLKINQFV